MFLKYVYKPSVIPVQRFFQKRFLSIYEYLSMGLLKTNNVAVPQGYLASSPAEVEEILSKWTTPTGEYIIKAKVLVAEARVPSRMDSKRGGSYC